MQTNNRRQLGLTGRLVIGLGMAIFALISYFGATSYNEITGETQHISLTKEQEITLGSQSVPQMESQYGGESQNAQALQLVQEAGMNVVQKSDASKAQYPFEFHLLADTKTINAFALPGGQVFITMALFNQLETKGQLAGVLAHEVGHVIARHSAEQIAQAQLTQGLTGAVVMASYDPDNPSTEQIGQMAALVGKVVNLKYGRDDELESDRLGVRFMAQAGYDPHALIGVMEILARAGGGARPPEFFSTHPNPENRVAEIQAAIEKEFPNGNFEGMVK